MKNVHSQKPKKVTQRHSVHNSRLNAHEVENVCQKLHSVTEKFNVPMAKTKKIAISVSQEGVQPIRFHAVQVNVYQNTSFVMP